VNRSDQDIINMIRQFNPEPPIDEAHRDRLRQQVLDAYDQRTVEDDSADHQPLFSFKGITIMKYAASIAILATVGFFASSIFAPKIAFAEVARAILGIETASFEVTVTITGDDNQPQNVGPYKVVTELPNKIRMHLPDGGYAIVDIDADTILTVIPEQKVAMLMDDYSNLGSDENPADFFVEMQDHLRRAKQISNFGDLEYEKLGEKQINGAQALGFRVLNLDGPEGELRNPDGERLIFKTIDIWADAKTGLPIEIVQTVIPHEHLKVVSTFKQFQYNQELDPKLFVLEAPEGYQVIRPADLRGKAEEAKKKAAEMQRKIDEYVTLDDLLDTLRAFAEHTDGHFPEELDKNKMMTSLTKAWEKANPGRSLLDEQVEVTDPQFAKVIEDLQVSYGFIRNLDNKAISYTYTGKGVKLGDKDKAIFRYKPAESETFTVVYGDLSVKQAEVEGVDPIAPNAAVGQNPVLVGIGPAPQEKPTLDDLAASLAVYATRTDGHLPPALVSGEMIDAMVEAWEQANPGKPLFKGDTIEYADPKLNRNVQDLLEAFGFVRELDKQGVAYTYAGKGVKLGDKDTPVLWFKPKGSETFTVVYGDMSARQADEAPAKP
jgi:outer membrane lipoprotein-sorting protein